MSIGDINPIPNGFIAKLLKEFGIEWTHVVIISGAVLSSFHLQSYISPGIWILGVVTSFALVYIFRFQITGNFVKTSVVCLAIVVVGILIVALLTLWAD